MRNPSKLFVLATLLAFLGSPGSIALGQERVFRPFSSGGSVLGVAATPSQRGIFAPFAAATCVTSPCPSGQLDTALSVSNTLAAPPPVEAAFEVQGFSDLEGTLEFYLWDTEGHLLFYETQADSPGVGLTQEPDREGFLAPGQTYRVLLSELLEMIDYAQHEIDFQHELPGQFAGYLWIVGNFDGIQGTTNLTDFSTFTQSLVMQPDLGSTFFDFSADAGVPLIPIPDEDPPEDP